MTKILLILLTVFTVNFWSDNTETKLLSSQQVEEASDAVPPADPDSACHSFTGWDKRYDNVLENLDIHATYTKNQYTLIIDNEHMSSEHGSIRALSPYSFDADGVMKDIPCGETVTVYAKPHDGYTFVKWVLNDVDQATTSSTFEVPMTRDTAIYAVFEAFTAFDIDFRSQEYVVTPSPLPEGAAVTGSYHNEHGYYQPKITLPLKAGIYKLTIGNCQHSGIGCSVKNAAETQTLNLIDANGQTVTSFTATDGCYNGTTNTTSVWLVLTEAQTIKVCCPQYTPYFKIEAVSSVPEYHTVHTVTYSAEGAEGTLPAGQESVDGVKVRIPLNRTLYKSGYTLTGWRLDEETVYNPGDSILPLDDITLTAVFEPNAQDLLTSTSVVTVTWQFGEANGAPSLHYEGSAGILVTQATVGSASVDVKMDINATAAKFYNKNRGDKWAQVTPNTTFSFPSKKDATVKVEVYNPGESSGSLDGQGRSSVVDNVATYTTANTSGTSLFEVGGGEYYSYLTIILPASKPTGTTDTKTVINAYKRIENNQVMIIRNNEKYDVTGKKL